MPAIAAPAMPPTPRATCVVVPPCRVIGHAASIVWLRWLAIRSANFALPAIGLSPLLKSNVSAMGCAHTPREFADSRRISMHVPNYSKCAPLTAELSTPVGRDAVHSPGRREGGRTMRIRKGIVALVGAGLLAGAGAGSYLDIGGNPSASEVACTVNNDDGIGGGGNR